MELVDAPAPDQHQAMPVMKTEPLENARPGGGSPLDLAENAANAFGSVKNEDPKLIEAISHDVTAGTGLNLQRLNLPPLDTAGSQKQRGPTEDLDEEEAALMLFSLSQAQPQQTSKRSASHKDLIKLQEVSSSYAT